MTAGIEGTQEDLARGFYVSLMSSFNVLRTTVTTESSTGEAVERLYTLAA